MSDAALDGGSGWPTAAYALVKRPDGTAEQPQPPERMAELPQRSDSPAREPHRAAEQPHRAPQRTASMAEKRAQQPEIPAQQNRRAKQPDPAEKDHHTNRRRVLSIAGGLVLILAVVIGVIIVTRAASTGAGTSAAASPRVETTPTDAPTTTASAPTTADAPTSAPTTPATTAAPESSAQPLTTTETGGVVRSGTVRLASITGRPAEAFDLDSGTKADANGFGAGQQPDVVAGATGLAAGGNAQFALWAGAGEPTSAGCAALPAAQWSPVTVVMPLALGPALCVRTSEGRLAGVIPRIARVGLQGELYTTLVDFTVWSAA
jgi:hypothetical protein